MKLTSMSSLKPVPNPPVERIYTLALELTEDERILLIRLIRSGRNTGFERLEHGWQIANEILNELGVAP